MDLCWQSNVPAFWGLIARKMKWRNGSEIWKKQSMELTQIEQQKKEELLKVEID